jgi:hypothetical protein
MRNPLLAAGIAALALMPSLALAQPDAPSAAANATNVVYNSGGDWNSAPGDVRAREDWLERAIRNDIAAGRLTQFEGNTGLKGLRAIRQEDQRLETRHNGLNPNDQNRLQAKLDTLSAQVRQMRHE